MQYLLIVLALAACFAIIHIFKIKGSKASLYLTIVTLVAAILAVIPFRPIAEDGFILFAICAGVSLFTTEAKDDIDKKDKNLLYVFSAIVALAAYPYLIPFAGDVYLSLVGIIPVFIFFYMALYKGKVYKNEFGYMAIFSAFSLLRAVTAIIILLNPAPTV